MSMNESQLWAYLCKAADEGEPADLVAQSIGVPVADIVAFAAGYTAGTPTRLRGALMIVRSIVGRKGWSL